MKTFQTSPLLWRAVRLLSAALLFGGSSHAVANNPGGNQTKVTTNVSTGIEAYHDPATGANRNDIFLDNGVIHALLQPTKASIDSLKYLQPGTGQADPKDNGVQMVSQSYSSNSEFGGHDQIYYSWLGSPSGSLTQTYTQNTSSIVDVCYKRAYQSGDPEAFDQEYHWILRKGDTGLYTYCVFSHAKTYPAASTGEINVMCPCAHDSTNFLCENVYIEDTILTDLKINGVQQVRAGLVENFLDTEKGVDVSGDPQEIQLLTTGTFSGDLDCKYSYNIDYGGTFCWGRASNLNHIGEWWVGGTQEYINDGPTVNEYPQGWGLLYYSFNSGHYGNTAVSISSTTKDWSKMWGPFLFYCNSQTTGAEAWADAKAQGEAEQGAWPYSWVTGQPAYQPASGRATVTGQVVLSDPLRPDATGAGAWVGLAAPDGGTENDPTNWQFQSDDYQYWTQADANGKFTLPAVRTVDAYGQTSTYALYVFCNGTSGGSVSHGTSSGTGEVGEYQSAPMSFKAGSTSLGTINWRVPHEGAAIVWEVGVPDRKALGYMHSDEYVNSALLGALNTGDFPNPLQIDTSSTDWAHNLNYAHSNYKSSNGSGGIDYTTWPWNFNFNLASAPAKGNYILNIAFASGQGTLQIDVNGTRVTSYSVPHPNDTYQRQGIHAKYQVAHFPFSSSLLNSGANTITLTEASVGNGNFEMYDYIDLETPKTVYEAESLTVQAYSAPDYRIVDDPEYSGGKGVILDSNAAGSYINFVVPNVSSGKYDVRVGVKKYNSRGIWQLSISPAGNPSGPNLGSSQDEYSASGSGVFTEFDLGTWTPGSTSDKWFKFTITGKNASSSDYTAAFDYITLIPQ